MIVDLLTEINLFNLIGSMNFEGYFRQKILPMSAVASYVK